MPATIVNRLATVRSNLIRWNKKGEVAQKVIRAGIEESAKDAYTRLRVSNPVSLFDSQFQYDKNPLLWNEQVVGSGSSTHLPNESSIRMDVTTTDADSIIRQSREYFRYQPGKSQLIILTFIFGSTETNCRKRVGYFDDNNGYYVENNNGNVAIVRRTKTSGSVVNDSIAQTDWNIDKLDGTTFSGITLDTSKNQLLFIDMEWLGTGRVRFGFMIAGQIHYAHEFLHANELDTVHITTANLPVRYEITNTGTLVVADSMKQVCSTVISEGGSFEERGFPFSASTAWPEVEAGTTEVPIISIKANTAINSIDNRGNEVILQDISIAAALADVHIRFRRNANVGNTSFTTVSSQSGMDYDISGNTVVAGSGDIVGQSTIPVGDRKDSGTSIFSRNNKLPFGFDIDGTNADTFTITAESRPGGTTNLTVSVDWLEIH